MPIGTRRRCLMKKTGHEKSRDTVPLRSLQLASAMQRQPIWCKQDFLFYERPEPFLRFLWTQASGLRKIKTKCARSLKILTIWEWLLCLCARSMWILIMKWRGPHKNRWFFSSLLFTSAVLGRGFQKPMSTPSSSDHVVKTSKSRCLVNMLFLLLKKIN